VIVDKAHEDVGRHLDISPAAARVRVHRGLSAIRDRLTGTGQTSEYDPAGALPATTLADPKEGASS
jgi:hypothetical protein